MTKLKEAKQELNDAVLKVKTAKSDVQDAVDTHEQDVEDNQDAVNTAQQKVADLQETIEQANDKEAIAELIREKQEAETDVAVSKQYAETMQAKGKDKIANHVEALQVSLREAKNAYKATASEVKKAVSMNTLQQEQDYLKEHSFTLNNIDGFSKSTLLDFEIISNKDVSYKKYHLNQTPLHTDLTSLYADFVLSDNGIRIN